MILLLQTAEPLLPLGEGPALFDARSIATVLIVVALLAGAAWWLRRHAPGRTRGQAIRIETAVPLGERRSLVVVTVEGRRLLLGLSPNYVNLVTELGPEGAPAFGQAMQTALQGESQG